MTATLSYRIRRAGPLFGAEVSDIDLTAPIDDSTRAALRREFDEHKVLVFRGANLTPAQQVEAVRIFDEPFDHPTAIRHDEHPLVYPYDVRSTGKASSWHVGGVWRTPPFSIESLVFEEVSDLGGHTLWADLQAAYDDLSDPFKALLEGVSAVYDSNAVHYAQGAERGDVKTTVSHPVVRVDKNGRKGLFISTGALRLEGLSDSEGRAVLSYLLEHASSPNYTIRFGWDAGDFVLWNNLATWHYAIDDYGTQPRRYRKVLAASPSEDAVGPV
ncbi:UNVERIFIED_CONTAM: taurine dioxygenase [Williamsia faeni]